MTKDELSNFDNDLTIKIANTFKNIFLSLQNNNTAFKSLIRHTKNLKIKNHSQSVIGQSTQKKEEAQSYHYR